MEGLALQMPLAIMGLSALSMLFGLMYIILAEPRKKVASGRCTCPCRDCQCRNPCQTDSEVPKPPPTTDPSIVDYYWYYYCYYYKYHYPNDSQVEVPNPPPLTTESFESDMSHSSPSSNACRDPTVVPKPPPVTDISIVWYYYYYYSCSYAYHYPDDCETDSKVTNPLSSTTENSRSAPFSGSSARVPQPMNTGRPRVPILKSVYMTNSASRIPRPIKRYGLHCGSRNKKVAFGETQVIRV